MSTLQHVHEKALQKCEEDGDYDKYWTYLYEVLAAEKVKQELDKQKDAS